MSYVSLYRKYRPRTFDEVVGQRHVIASLRNAIAQDQLHHAYLFAGPRGTGKTTIARILAAAVNATGGPNADFDVNDPVAVDIRAGSTVDVIELDMASHGGVEDARELRDRAMFSPVSLRKKVYILDEVHMASQAAFNALLKVIEEPPEHVLFAMATTDPHKVIPTILSRVQRLDLRRVPASDLSGHLRSLGEKEGFTIDDDALAMVLRAGDGSVRDTLSVLEQVISHASGEVTATSVGEVLGATPTEVVADMTDLIDRGDVAGLFSKVHALADAGHDLRRFSLDLVQHLRDVLVVAASHGDTRLLDTTDVGREQIASQADRISQAKLLRAVDLLADIVSVQRTGPQRLPLELALAKAASPGSDIEGLVARIDELEKQLASGSSSSPAAASAADPTPASPAPAAASTPAAARPQPEPAPGQSTAQPASDPVHTVDVTDPAPAPAPASAPATATQHAQTPSVSVPPVTPAPEAVVETADPVVPQPAPAAKPATTEPALPAPTTGAATGETGEQDPPIEAFVQKWSAILDVVAENSKRVEAFVAQGQPVRFQRRILTVQFADKHRFHGEQLGKPANTDILRDAVAQVMGLKAFHVEVATGDAPSRAPLPPTVDQAMGDMPSREDAQRAVQTAPARPTLKAAEPDVRADVREAESGESGEVSVDDAVALAVEILDASPVE